MTTTPFDLDEIEARAGAATPGPWGVYQYGGDSLIEIAADLEDTGCGYRARRTVCRFDEEPLDNDPTHREWTAEEDWEQVQADAEFTAHAREDVDALLAALLDSRAEVEKLARWHREDETALAEMRATVERLRARRLTPAEYDTAWHAVEGAAGEDGADPGTVLHAVLDRLGIEWQVAARPAAVEKPEACGKCKQPFDATDKSFDGRARFYLTPFCRGCVDRCHDTEIADHRCVICANPKTGE